MILSIGQMGSTNSKSITTESVQEALTFLADHDHEGCDLWLKVDVGDDEEVRHILGVLKGSL